MKDEIGEPDSDYSERMNQKSDTPHIHSDPANGGKYADLQMQMEHRGPYSDPAGEDKEQILKKWLYKYALTLQDLSRGTTVVEHIIYSAMDEYKAKSPTPQTAREEYERGLNDGHVAAMEQMKEHQQQTGRTYTEGEVIGLLEWMRESGYHPVVTNNGTLTGWLKGGMSVIHPSKAMPHEYLKQNPKP